MLIFGKLGAPALGVVGAAAATTVSRIVEFAIVLTYTLVFEKQIRLRIRELIHLDKTISKPFFRNCIPVMCNELLWSAGASLLTVVMGHMGQEMVSANSIYTVISQFSSVMVQGLSSAAAVLIGNTIGAGEYDQIDFKVATLQKLGTVMGALAGCIVFFSRPLMLVIYNVGETTKLYVDQIMIVGAFLELFNALVFVNMVGILRGGGDAKFVRVNDILFLWTIAVPLGFLAGLVWNWPVPLVFFILKSDNLIKLVTSFIRIRQKNGSKMSRSAPEHREWSPAQHLHPPGFPRKLIPGITLIQQQSKKGTH